MTLHARLLAGREASVDLPNGKTVRVRRPPEVEIPRLLLVEHSEPVEQTRLPVDTE